MPQFVLYRPADADRNERGLHAAVVNAADLNGAIAAAEASAPWTVIDHGLNPPGPGARGIARWAAVDLSTLASGQLVWFEGDCVSLLGTSRGGNRFP